MQKFPKIVHAFMHALTGDDGKVTVYGAILNARQRIKKIICPSLRNTRLRIILCSLAEGPSGTESGLPSSHQLNNMHEVASFSSSFQSPYFFSDAL